MKFCRQIDKYNRVFYDPIKNEFLLNGKEPIPVSLGDEYNIIEIVEMSEIAGLSTDEILSAVAGYLLKNVHA